MASRRTSRRPKRTSRKPTKRTSRGARTLKRNGGLSDFTSAYIDTALWLTADETDERQLNGRERDLDPHTRHQMELDAATFFEEHRDTWDGIDDARAGRNFWLSRNGHGTGFFDEYDLSAATRKKLQTASKKFGEFDLYVGDDRKIHGSPLEQMPLEANVKPSVKKPVAPRNFKAWVRRTFAPGTPVKTLTDTLVLPTGHMLLHASGPRVGSELLRAGTRGVVTEATTDFGVPEIRIEITDARDGAGIRLDRVIGKTLTTLNDDFIEPLVDNWLAPNKRTSRGLRANTIPPPPFGHIDLGHWAKRTFAVGTPVRLRMPWDFRSGQDAFPRVFPAGTRAEVVDLESTGLTIRTKVVSPLLLSAEREGFYADVYYSSAAQVLEPLVDNWGPSAPPSKRTSLPKSQRGLSMKHRRLMPNATCPACGSPDYFEGPWNRDCATPDCRYFRGGTAKGPHYESESVVAKPLGSRRLGFTSETVHPSEPDVYPEIDNEGLDDIVIDSDDLDEDETFAERAAKIIGEELGHVEGSDGGRGPSRWYTQADASEDYSTGESERRSIHIDDKEWTPEEQQEIYDDLKKRRLIS